MPGSVAELPEAPAVISQSAWASCRASFALASVARGVAACAGRAGPAAGSDGTGTTSGFVCGQLLGTAPPSIHVRTAFTAQPDGSAVTVLCPTPGTTSRCPCGKRATTEAAPAVGVRMSKPPLTASIGTFGNGPAPSGSPVGDGQPTQVAALPSSAAQGPNGPRVPAGSDEIAACRIAGRCATGVSGAHGNGPSRHVVAAYSPELSSTAGSSFSTSCRYASRSSGCVLPARAACMTAGSSAARPGLRSASRTTVSTSSPSTRFATCRPLLRRTFPCSGFAAYLFASATTSDANAAPLQPSILQNVASVVGMVRRTFDS